jgi:hypothetical protein
MWRPEPTLINGFDDNVRQNNKPLINHKNEKQF